jgi:Raf kinase inhibitor-like YbhB/YbcL family protein
MTSGPTTHAAGEPISIMRVHPREQGRLALSSPAISRGGRIDDLYSAYHDNLSPPLEWTVMPDAESFALIVEDPDAPQDKPFVHWMIWNLSGKLEALPRGVPTDRRLGGPGLLEGAVQGRNGAGEYGYFGPRPPAGHGPHRYHFQLFALDTVLRLDPDTPLEELVHVLKARTIAKDELVGLYEAPDLH